ncbi:Nuclear transport factor 2 (NTF2) family protein with RNA binding (RRM-RBD-RNP motifs) domain [Striga hermonthica]|uniref:Nuclear transport factor 2 (NTF2) family protein with RNA binding (RRM-RBD-RNP motifs) domain n=1 Tax=Striga hermonthica TaxID=68872 RepID=A0A9N7MX83_STRHE|nr:Nuclear transport factor 2 (NTF2) family protein with RNA binding (RRM-RBD-RNP motifs) domain [Striga hermonthica]
MISFSLAIVIAAITSPYSGITSSVGSNTSDDALIMSFSAAIDLAFSSEAEQELQPEPEPELEPQADGLDEGTPYEEPSPLLQSTATAVREPHHSVEEPIGEPEKLTYASILRAKGKAPPLVSFQPAFTQRPPVAEWNHVSQPPQQHSTPNPPNSSLDVTEDALSSHEGEPKSVYVRNLPSTITSTDIQQEFENFGRIKYDGVFLRNRADTGVCYAFVEFEDIQSVRNALQASPIQLAGRKVYIEERRPNSGATRGGRSGGRGRGGGRGGRTYGR